MNVLTLNLGSSSLKYAVHAIDGARVQCVIDAGTPAAPQPEAAARASAAAIAAATQAAGAVDAIGHRVVFGGPDDAPALVTPPLTARLQALEALDPLHVPGSLAVMAAAQRALPGVPNVACFDTHFFHDLPDAARTLPLPVSDPFLRRYGFHGLSYESAVRTLGNELAVRTVVAHLGSGCSAAALYEGRPVESTMGFSPLGGLIMSTRPGDLDPGTLLYLLERGGVKVAQLRDMLENQSGLRAISDGESDIQKLCARTDSRARLAVDMFVRSAARAIGALATCLGGVEMLLFTGGIGEHNTAVRNEITGRVTFLNPRLDVRVVKSDENLAMALLTAQTLASENERQ